MIKAFKVTAVIVTFPILALPLLVLSVAKVILDWSLFPRQSRFSYGWPGDRHPPNELSGYRLNLPPENPILIGYDVPPSCDILHKGTIVYFHGNGVTAADDFIRYSHSSHTKHMTAGGYRVVCATYPGYGGSAGMILSEQDVLDAGQIFVDYAKTLKTADAPELILWGWSIGSGIAMRLAADNAEAVTKVVLQAPYYDLNALVQEKAPSCRCCAYVLRYNLDTRQDLLRFCNTSDNKEVVLLHAPGDSIISAAHSERLSALHRNTYRSNDGQFSKFRYYSLRLPPSVVSLFSTRTGDRVYNNHIMGMYLHTAITSSVVLKALDPSEDNRQDRQLDFY